MHRIPSTPEEYRAAVARVRAELEYYDTHPTEVEHLFVAQADLRRLVQLVEDLSMTDPTSPFDE